MKKLLKSMICGSIAIGFIALIFITTGMSIVFNLIDFIKSDPFAGTMTTFFMVVPLTVICCIINRKKNK